MTPDLRAQIDAFGRELTLDLIVGTSKLMGQMFEGMDPQTIEDVDVAYGSDPRQRLDVYRQQNLENAPVFVFVHGGGFVMGDKRSEGPFYRNVGDFAARHGWIGVVPTYRLAPQHQWPAGAEDLALVLKWIVENVAEFGGDPSRIVISGQSAGAVHVASYVAHSRFHVAPGGGVRGAVLMSGLYDTERVDPSDNHRAYYGDDASKYAEASCVPGLVASEVPLCFTISEFDPPMFQQEAARTVASFGQQKAVYPEMHYLVGHNHLTPSQSLGTPIRDIEALLADFVGRVTG